LGDTITRKKQELLVNNNKIKSIQVGFGCSFLLEGKLNSKIKKYFKKELKSKENGNLYGSGKIFLGLDINKSIENIKYFNNFICLTTNQILNTKRN
jgi:hypothetical protein